MDVSGSSLDVDPTTWIAADPVQCLLLPLPEVTEMDFWLQTKDEDTIDALLSLSDVDLMHEEDDGTFTFCTHDKRIALQYRFIPDKDIPQTNGPIPDERHWHDLRGIKSWRLN